MATTLNTIPAEEGDTLLPKKPQASLKFQAHMGAANASTKATASTPSQRQLQMAPSHCVGKSGKCNPPNGDKVVGDDTWSEIEWTRV